MTLRNNGRSVSWLRTWWSTHSIVVPLQPSTYWPLMNKPVLKDVLPLYTSVFHSWEKISGMVQARNEVDSTCKTQWMRNVGCAEDLSYIAPSVWNRFQFRSNTAETDLILISSAKPHFMNAIIRPMKTTRALKFKFGTSLPLAEYLQHRRTISLYNAESLISFRRSQFPSLSPPHRWFRWCDFSMLWMCCRGPSDLDRRTMQTRFDAWCPSCIKQGRKLHYTDYRTSSIAFLDFL